MPNQFRWRLVGGGAGHGGGHCHLLRQSPLRHPKARRIVEHDKHEVLAEYPSAAPNRPRPPAVPPPAPPSEQIKGGTAWLPRPRLILESMLTSPRHARFLPQLQTA